MIEEKIFRFALGLICLSVILALLTGCSPLEELPVPTFTPAPAKPALTEAIPLPTPTVTTPQVCTVRTGIPAGRLNMRTGAGVKYTVVQVLAEGEVLQVIARGAWLKVIDAQGNQGFINGRYCR